MWRNCPIFGCAYSFRGAYTSTLLNSTDAPQGVPEWHQKIQPGIYLIVLKTKEGVTQYYNIIYN